MRRSDAMARLRRHSVLSGTERGLYFLMIGFNSFVTLLGALVVVACIVNPKAMGGQPSATGVAIGAGVATAFATYLIQRSLRSVAIIDVEDDGSWTLRSPGGWRVGTAPVGTPRELEVWARAVVVGPNVGMIREYKVSRGTLAVGPRCFRMLPANSANYERMLDSLGARPEAPPEPGQPPRRWVFSAGRPAKA